MQSSISLALDEAILNDLYQRHAHILFTFIRRYTSTHEDAEDILLDVFLAAAAEAKLVSMNENQRQAWLRRVARNKCIDAYRHIQQHHPMLNLDDIADQLYTDEEHGPEYLALRSEEQALLREQLARLPAAQQELLRLRFANDLRCSEVARLHHKREGTVRMLLSRSLNLLRELYNDTTEGE